METRQVKLIITEPTNKLCAKKIKRERNNEQALHNAWMNKTARQNL